jgi:hypothetical protein
MSNWYHVIPKGDRIEHSRKGEAACACECQPKIHFNDHVVIHNALDNREFDEIAEGINAEV